MKRNQEQRLLEKSLAELATARRHLDYSSRRAAEVPAALEGATESQLEIAEAFTSRFARAVDLLVNKVLRGLDRVELNPDGSLLDIINRAEKRGLIAHADELRQMKVVRNMIAHDYAGAQAPEILAFCKEQKPIFDGICERVTSHAKQILSTRS